MTRALKVVAVELGQDPSSIDWGQIGYQDAARVRAGLSARFSPATVNKSLAALRGVLREALRLGMIDPQNYARAIDVACVRGTRVPRGRALQEGELRAVFAACAKGTAGGARDAALVSLLYAGLRRTEVVSLDVADYEPSERSLVVRGKGDRERIVYIPSGGADAIAAWLALRGQADGPLVLPVNKAGTITHRRMSTHAVMLIVRRLAERAGLPRLSPHDFRRTVIGDLLDRGADIATTAALVGHRQITTTQLYDRRPLRTRKRAMDLLEVPYAPAPRPEQPRPTP